ncbi:uncharacterized protein TNCV_1519801 [Trichonephila clavipes]|nr:uncharacterized protein TNCV_1519801 [Trichonephila clavipes]
MGSRRDPVRRVGFLHHSMIEHLVKWLKAPPNQIGIGSTPGTGRRKFIDQHGGVGRLNKGCIEISQKPLGEFLPQDIIGSEFVHVFRLHYGTLEIIQQRLFFGPFVFTKNHKHTFRVGFMVNDASMDFALPSCIFNASGFSGSVTGISLVEMCSGNALIWSIVLAGREATDVKRRDESSFVLSNRMWVEPSVANHG